MTHPSMVCTIPLTLAEADSVTMPNGDVITFLDVLELVPQDQVGGAGKFNPADFVDETLSIFADESARGFEPPFVLGHPKKADGSPDESVPAVAWTMGLERVGTRLRAKVRVLAEFATRIRKGEFRYASPELRPYHDQTGVYRGIKLCRVGVTNTPFQKGADGQPIGMWSLAELSDVPEAEHAPNPLPVSSGQENDMDEAAIKALIAKENEGLIAQLSEANKTIGDLTMKVTGLDAALKDAKAISADLSEKVTAIKAQPAPANAMELAEARATVADKQARIDGLERGIKAQSVKNLVSLAESEFKLTPAIKARILPGFDADPVKALDDSPLFGGRVAALAEWYATAPPAVTATTRTSASAASTDDGGPSLKERAASLRLSEAEVAAYDAAIAEQRR